VVGEIDQHRIVGSDERGDALGVHAPKASASVALTTRSSVRSSDASIAPLIATDLCAALSNSVLTACGSAVAANPANAATSEAAISVLSGTLSSNGQTDRILGNRIER
jgi:hypothetical protein